MLSDSPSNEIQNVKQLSKTKEILILLSLAALGPFVLGCETLDFLKWLIPFSLLSFSKYL